MLTSVLPLMKRKYRTVPKFAANLNWLFTEVDFLDRFAAAAAAGFRGVECLFPYDYKTSEVVSRLSDNNLQQVLINAPPGDWQKGERGLGCLAGRQAEFRDSINKAIEYAQAIDCPKVHIMAGLAGADARDLFVENLYFAAEACAAAGLLGLIEPINDRDMPGYFLTRPDQALEILKAVASPHLRLQLDLYHAARMGFDVALTIDNYINSVAHFQIAGVPDRHEPDSGEVDYQPLFNNIDQLGYDGWIGCEYRPRRTTGAGLGWAASYL